MMWEYYGGRDYWIHCIITADLTHSHTFHSHHLRLYSTNVLLFHYSFHLLSHFYHSDILSYYFELVHSFCCFWQLFDICHLSQNSLMVFKVWHKRLKLQCKMLFNILLNTFQKVVTVCSNKRHNSLSKSSLQNNTNGKMLSAFKIFITLQLIGGID